MAAVTIKVKWNPRQTPGITKPLQKIHAIIPKSWN